MHVQKRSQIFDSVKPFSILSFTYALKLECDTNRLHEGAALLLVHFFMERPAANGLSARIALKSK